MIPALIVLVIILNTNKHKSASVWQEGSLNSNLNLAYIDKLFEGLGGWLPQYYPSAS